MEMTWSHGRDLHGTRLGRMDVTCTDAIVRMDVVTCMDVLFIHKDVMLSGRKDATCMDVICRMDVDRYGCYPVARM